MDRLPAGALLVLAGVVPGHHGGPAAERHRRGGLYDVAVAADSGKAAQCEPVHVRDAAVQEDEHLHHRHVAVPVCYGDAGTGGPYNERQPQPSLCKSLPLRCYDRPLN